MLGNGGFIVETADDVEVLRGSDLTVLASVPKQGKTGKQGQSAGTSLSGKAKEPRPPRPAPLPPVFVDGKLLPSPEYGPLGYRQPMPKERSPPNMMGSKAIP